MINKLIGLPDLASEHGLLIDNMLELLHWFIALLLVGWTLFYFYCLIRFRKGAHPKADYHGVRGHASTHIEIGVVIVEAVLLLGFAFPLWSQRVDDYPGTDPRVVKVRVIGEQFKWAYHYPGHDGKFGLTRPKLMETDPTGLGLDPNDPYGKDDFLAGALILPKDRNCILEISSKDVIHNAAIVPMRIQHDAIPGTPAHMWFKPTKTGEWPIICAQLCGSNHSSMKGRIEVKEGKEYDEWFQGKADAAAPKPKEDLGEAKEKEKKTAPAAVSLR